MCVLHHFVPPEVSVIAFSPDYAVFSGTNQGSQGLGQGTSKVLFFWVPIENILMVADRKTPTTFVACYLMDTLSIKAAFGHAVLNIPPGDFPLVSLDSATLMH